MTTHNFRVAGMTCPNCVRHVTEALEGVGGVTRAEVQLDPGRALVEAEGAIADALMGAVREAGYEIGEEDDEEPASPGRVDQAEAATPPIRPTTEGAGSRIEIDVGGMTCAACVGAVERALGGVEGVVGVEVSLPLERASVMVGGDAAGDRELTPALVDAVRRSGYSARPRTAAGGAGELAREREAAEKRLAHVGEARRRFLLSAVLSVPIFAGTMAGEMLLGLELPGWFGWAQLVLTSAVMLGPGRAIFAMAIRQTRHLGANMDSLVALGTAASWAASTISLVRGGPLYFESAAAIITLVLLGRFLEARARGRAGEAIRSLLARAPRIAHHVEEGGRERDLPVEELRVGDLLRIRPGEAIPVDGVLVEGRSAVDEALMTGESMPVDRVEGDALIGGTHNTVGSFVMRAERVGDGTRLAAIVRLVLRAQSSKAPVQRLADRIAAVFVPIVLAVALATAAAWALSDLSRPWPEILLPAVAVLVIACPCAMGLATPTAVVVGTGRAARRGILIRDAASLERAHEISTVVFDKTGTLTEGKPAVRSVQPAPGVSREELLATAAAVERASEHPLARAIVAAAGDGGFSVPPAKQFEAEVGRGARAIVGGVECRVGKSAYVAELAGQPSSGEPGDPEATSVSVGSNDRYLGRIELADPVRATAPEAIERLGDRGIETVLLSGDHQAVAERVGRDLGLERVIAGILPEGKVDAIDEMARPGKVIAMVGDGLNDAPALAAADVGIAMGGGADVAMETATITLMGNDPRGVPEAIALSRATLRIIRQNLFWAFAYNILGIPVAAAGLLNPMIAAAAMAASSVLVVTNSLRLRTMTIS